VQELTGPPARPAEPEDTGPEDTGPPSDQPGNGRRARRRWIDVLPVAGLVVLVHQTEAGLYWPHGWVRIPWGDWAAHAYRATFLSRWGLVNWTPDWNAGLPLFQSYQTAPHALVVALSSVADVTITHSMMMWTAVMLFYPVAGYVVLRRLGLGVWGALLGAVLLFDTASVAPPIQDFSYLFGLALVPLLFWFAVRGLGTRAGYPGAVVLGLSPYFHPYGTVAGLALVLVRLLLDRFRVNRRTVLQGVIAVMVSSFYWLPYLVSAKPRFSDPWNWSTAFARELFARFGYRGLSIGVIVAAATTLAALAIGRIERRRIVVCGFGAAALLAVSAYLHLEGWLPRELMSIEPSRWMPLVSALLAMGSAPLGDALASGLRARATGGSRPAHLARAVLTALLAAGIAACAVEGAAWYRRSTIPIGDKLGFGDELEQWARARPDLRAPSMVWAHPNDVAFASYFSFGRFHFTGDYIVTRQWTVAAPALSAALGAWGPGAPATTGDFSRAERYLRMYGVRYLELRRSEPAHAAFVDGPLKGKLRILSEVPGGWVAEVPWEPVGAFAAPAAELRKATVPDLEFLTYEEMAIRDRMVDAYNALKHSPAATPAEVTWHSPTRLTVEVQARPGDALVVPQNWDTVWKATVGRKAPERLPVERVGPNFFAVRLDGLEGPLTVEVEHGPYPTWIASFGLIGLGLVIAAAAFVLDGRRTRRQRSLGA
jgi:hypothetical protein